MMYLRKKFQGLMIQLTTRAFVRRLSLHQTIKYALLTILIGLGQPIMSQIDTAGLHLPTLSACAGDTVFVALTVDNFTSVSGYQFGLSWAENQLTYLATCDLAAGMPEDVVTVQSDTRLQFTWLGLFTNQELTLPDNDTLLVLKFIADNIPSGGVPLIFDPTVSALEVALVDANSNINFYEPQVTNGLLTRDESINLQAMAEPLTCDDDPAELSVISSLPGTEFMWSGPNSFIDSAAITNVDSAGLYMVIGQNGNCLDTAEVSVVYDTIAPEPLVFLPPDTLDCIQLSTTLTVIPNDPGFNCSWLGITADTCTVEVSAPGVYTALVTNPANGCQRQDSLNVLSNAENFAIQLTPQEPFLLSCLADTLFLSANANIANLDWVWTEEDGTIISLDTFSLLNTAGNYLVAATNPLTGCRDEISFSLAADFAAPTLELLGDTILNCIATSQNLDATSNMANVDYEWYTPDGSLASSAPSLLATFPGAYILVGTAQANGCSDTLLFTTTIDTVAASIDILPESGVITCIEDTFVARLNTNAVDFDLTWTNELGETISTTDSVVMNHGGIYEVLLVNNTNGCTSSDMLSVIVDTLAPTINIPVPDTLSCVQQSVDLVIQTPDTGVSCEWIGITANCMAQATTPGIYIAQLTNNLNGCITTDSIMVFSSEDEVTLDILPVESLNCNNDSVVISIAQVSPVVEYQWFDENDVAIFVGEQVWVQAEGTYTIVATDTTNGCDNSLEVEVNADFTLPQGEVGEATDLNCEVETSELTVADVGANTTFTWQNAAGELLNSTVVSEAGTYFVTFEQTNSFCTRADSLVVPIDTLSPNLVAEFVGDSIITCVQATVQLQAISQVVGEFTWTDTATGLSLGNSNTLLVEEARQVLVSIINPVNGCVADALLSVQENRTPPLADIDILAPFDCLVAEAELAAAVPGSSGNYQYQWQYLGSGIPPADPNGSQTTVFQPGSYVLEVEDAENGCAAKDTLFVPDNFSLSDLNVSIIDAACGEDNGAVEVVAVTGGTAPYSYALNGGDFSQLSFYSDLAAGTYELLVEDAQGCQGDTTLIIQELLPPSITLQQSPPPYTIGDEFFVSLSASPADSVNWYWNDSLVCINCQEYNQVLLSTSELFVEIIDPSGCSASTTVQIVVNENVPIFIPNAFTPDNDGVNDRLAIAAGNAVVSIKEWQIFARWGNLVYERKNFSPNDQSIGWNGKVGTELAPMGTYVYQLIATLINGEEIIIYGDFVLLR